MIRRSVERGVPYSLAFVDVRMPPGWDGIETLSLIWKEDTDIQAVICSAYSDYALAEIHARFGETDSLLLVSKPFDPIKIRQIAFALTEKWNQHYALKQAASRLSMQYAATKILLESPT